MKFVNARTKLIKSAETYHYPPTKGPLMDPVQFHRILRLQTEAFLYAMMFRGYIDVDSQRFTHLAPTVNKIRGMTAEEWAMTVADLTVSANPDIPFAPEPLWLDEYDPSYIDHGIHHCVLHVPEYGRYYDPTCLEGIEDIDYLAIDPTPDAKYIPLIVPAKSKSTRVPFLATKRVTDEPLDDEDDEEERPGVFDDVEKRETGSARHQPAEAEIEDFVREIEEAPSGGEVSI